MPWEDEGSHRAEPVDKADTSSPPVRTLILPPAFADAPAGGPLLLPQGEKEICDTALFAWFSPAFPTGGFAYSHGIETAVAEGRIVGERGLADWLADVLAHGAGWSDAVLLSLARRAGDDAALLDVADLAAALAPSRERAAETLGQGEAFLRAVRTGWPGVAPDALPDRVAYPVAAGAAARGIGAPVTTVVVAYLTGFAANLIAAGVRLSLCGQSGGVRILSGLGPLIAQLALRAAEATQDDLGGCALASDIAAMRHETLHTRLFIT
jgi:urease accessory protein